MKPVCMARMYLKKEVGQDALELAQNQLDQSLLSKQIKETPDKNHHLSCLSQCMLENRRKQSKGKGAMF